MSSFSLSLITFLLVFGGAVFGNILRGALPEHELSAESKDAVKVGVGLIATMAALVLGLLSSFDAQNNELTELSSRIVLLDHVLARYGDETKDARAELRIAATHAVESLSSKTAGQQALGAANTGEGLYEKISALTPKDDRQRAIYAQAMSIMMNLGETRWLIATQTVNSVSLPILTILIFWLTIIFVSFGLFAPRKWTVGVSLFVSALSVSGAIFLILELYSPYGGVIRVSSAPLRAALTHLGQ
ncbi:MAG: hypothetical protein ABSC71_18730 [Candidatus Acidiferrales bacterium]